MTRREFDRLISIHIIPRLSNYLNRKGLLFECPLRYLLRGYSFQPSGFDKNRFCVQLFVQPLFVPSDCIYFLLGDRLGILSKGKERWWSVDEETEKNIMDEVWSLMEREGPKLLNKFKSLRDIADRAVAHHQNKHDLYVPEMAAYAGILLDDASTAQEMFDCAEKRMAMDDDRRDWVVALIERIRTMRTTFDRDPEEAKAILHRWRDETASNLKLTEFIDDTAPA